MMRAATVISGRPGQLAASIATELLRSGPLLCAATPRRCDALQRLVQGGGTLQRIDPAEIPPGARVWHFIAAGEGIEPSLLRHLQRARLCELNLVAAPYGGGERWRWLAPAPASDAVDPASIGAAVTRSFRTALTIADAPQDDAAQEGLLHLLATVDDFISEIGERAPHYFEHHALRCALSPDAPVDLIDVEQAAAMMLAIAARAGSGDYLVSADQSLRAEELFEAIGEVYDLSLLAAPDAVPSRLDALFELRLQNFASHLVGPDPVALTRSWQAAGIEPERLRLSPAELRRLLEANRKRQRDAQSARAARRAAVPQRLHWRELSRDGRPLRYASIGSGGKTLVLINALGEASVFFHRLIEELQSRFRVLLWDPRGLEPDEDPMGIADHAADLAAILRAEAVTRCDLVAWCTGPKVAAAFCIGHPGVVGRMVFLNATAKGDGSPPELDTPYEHNFAQLCRVLLQRPAMAESVKTSLCASLAPEAVDLYQPGGDDLSEAVLASMNRDLHREVLRPFRDAGTVMKYVGQLIDFWRFDWREVAASIEIPVLLLSAEHDRVASPAASDWIAGLLPRSRHLHAPGATHYFLYDRADVVARLIEDFIDEGTSVPAAPASEALQPVPA